MAASTHLRRYSDTSESIANARRGTKENGRLLLGAGYQKKEGGRGEEKVTNLGWIDGDHLTK